MNTEISPYIDYDLEEILLSEGIEIGESAKIYLNEIKRIPQLTPETEKQFLNNLDDKTARTKLMEGYLKFVVMIAKEYINNGMKLIDLIQSGNLSLIKAVESFDGNISFAEHTENSVRCKIADDIDYDKNSVRIPVFTINTIERSADENGNITVKKLADVLKHTEFDARQMSAIYRFCKRQNINIISSADPYITDIEKIISAESIKITELLREDFAIINTIPLLTQDEEKQLFQNFENDKNVYFNLFIKYRRFVIIIAKDYINSKHNLYRLMGVGTIGLAKAIQSFDHIKDMKFSVFAEWIIRQEIIRQIEYDKNN